MSTELSSPTSSTGGESESPAGCSYSATDTSPRALSASPEDVVCTINEDNIDVYLMLRPYGAGDRAILDNVSAFFSKEDTASHRKPFTLRMNPFQASLLKLTQDFVEGQKKESHSTPLSHLVEKRYEKLRKQFEKWKQPSESSDSENASESSNVQSSAQKEVLANSEVEVKAEVSIFNFATLLSFAEPTNSAITEAVRSFVSEESKGESVSVQVSQEQAELLRDSAKSCEDGLEEALEAARHFAKENEMVKELKRLQLERLKETGVQWLKKNATSSTGSDKGSIDTDRCTTAAPSTERTPSLTAASKGSANSRTSTRNGPGENTISDTSHDLYTPPEMPPAMVAATA